MTDSFPRDALTSDDIPPGPFSEHDLREQWNAQAGKDEQWNSLDSSEQLAWAQARAIGADCGRRPAIRAALERLVELSNKHAMASVWDAAFFNAHAVLAAEPVGDGPSDEELDLLVIAIQTLLPHQPDATTHDLASVDRGRRILRQSLARWGCPAAPPTPEPGGGRWSEGICGDGAAILFDGVMVPIEEVVRALNRTPAAPAAPEVGRVAIPCNADIAAAMVPLGEGYLREHAPDRLRPATPAVPEPGEVGELADRLGWIAAQLGDIGWSDDSASVVRAATLLQQLAAPAPAVVPVAVAERPWEREGWCGKWGYCWRFDPCENGWWSYGPPVDLMNDPGDWTHMASHDAIPLPQAGEVEA